RRHPERRSRGAAGHRGGARRVAQCGRPTLGLPVPHPLPVRTGDLRTRGATTAARRPRRPPGRLPLPAAARVTPAGVAQRARTIHRLPSQWKVMPESDGGTMNGSGDIAVQRFVDTYRPDEDARVPEAGFLDYARQHAPAALLELWSRYGLGFY